MVYWWRSWNPPSFSHVLDGLKLGADGIDDMMTGSCFDIVLLCFIDVVGAAFCCCATFGLEYVIFGHYVMFWTLLCDVLDDICDIWCEICDICVRYVIFLWNMSYSVYCNCSGIFELQGLTKIEIAGKLLSPLPCACTRQRVTEIRAGSTGWRHVSKHTAKIEHTATMVTFAVCLRTAKRARDPGARKPRLTTRAQHTAKTKRTGKGYLIYRVRMRGNTGKMAARHLPDSRVPPCLFCRATAHGKYSIRYRVPLYATHGNDSPSPSTVVNSLRVPPIVFTVRPEIGHTAKSSFPCISPPCALCRVWRTAKTSPCVFWSSPCASGTRQRTALP